MSFVYEEAGDAKCGFFQLRKTKGEFLFGTCNGYKSYELKPSIRIPLHGCIGSLLDEWHDLHQNGDLLSVAGLDVAVDQLVKEERELCSAYIQQHAFDHIEPLPRQQHVCDSWELYGEAIMSRDVYPYRKERPAFIQPRALISFALRSMHDSIRVVLEGMVQGN